jgi:hypothetical protein
MTSGHSLRNSETVAGCAGVPVRARSRRSQSESAFWHHDARPSLAAGQRQFLLDQARHAVRDVQLKQFLGTDRVVIYGLLEAANLALKNAAAGPRTNGRPIFTGPAPQLTGARREDIEAVWTSATPPAIAAGPRSIIIETINNELPRRGHNPALLSTRPRPGSGGHTGGFFSRAEIRGVTTRRRPEHRDGNERDVISGTRVKFRGSELMLFFHMLLAGVIHQYFHLAGIDHQDLQLFSQVLVFRARQGQSRPRPRLPDVAEGHGWRLHIMPVTASGCASYWLLLLSP